METNHLELPAALLKAAGLDNSHLSEDAARLLAVEKGPKSLCRSRP